MPCEYTSHPASQLARLRVRSVGYRDGPSGAGTPRPRPSPPPAAPCPTSAPPRTASSWVTSHRPLAMRAGGGGMNAAVGDPPADAGDSRPPAGIAVDNRLVV